MKLGLFIALLLALVVIVGLIVPIPVGLPAPPPGTAGVPTRAQCLALHTDEPLYDEPLPPQVQLLPHPAPGNLNDGPTYRVNVEPESLRVLFAFAAWQPAGPDSIDIAWHHSPVLRIPARGKSRVGRVTRRGHSSFFYALLAPDRVLRVGELPCPPGIDVRRPDEGST